MIVPAEIIGHILSFLQSHPEVLRNCSESHPLLSQLAEPHLYAHVVLETGDPAQKPANLIKLLSKRPHIARYISSLEIRVIYRGDDLEQISLILPMLVQLRAITFTSLDSRYLWHTYPENFRVAFLACLRLQSMRDVCLDGFDNVPVKSVLNGECKALRSLTVCNGVWRDSNRTSSDTLNLDGWTTDGNTSPGLSLRLNRCREDFVLAFVPWFIRSCRLRLRSLDFSSVHSSDYDLLPELLANSSNSLTTLDLDVGLLKSDFYNFNRRPLVHTTTKIIPIPLSSLPHLEYLTVLGTFRYHPQEVPRIWGIFSPLLPIMNLFSYNTASKPPSLRCLTFDFKFDIRAVGLVQITSLPWFELSQVICTPLVRILHELSEWSSTVVPLQIELSLTRNQVFVGDLPNPLPSTRGIPLNVIHSLLLYSEDLMRFVDQGTLVVTPPATSNMSTFPTF